MEVALDTEDAADVARKLEERESAARRHTLWSLLGVSPMGILPLVAATSEFGVMVLILGMTLIATTEAVRAVRARAEARALREELHSLTSPWTSSRVKPTVRPGGSRHSRVDPLEYRER